MNQQQHNRIITDWERERMLDEILEGCKQRGIARAKLIRGGQGRTARDITDDVGIWAMFALVFIAGMIVGLLL